MKKINIAIDGPSAAGKGTIADCLAEKLSYIHLDTGAMYRCVALACLRAGVPFKDEERVMEILEDVDIDQTVDGRSILNGEDVSEEIRHPEISLGASDVSTLKLVRKDLVRRQKKIARRKGYILEGRDIGTVVLKNAELKIYLTASVEVRAMRRYKQNLEKGMECNLEEICQQISERDYQDMHRKESPLKKADDAVEVDSSDLSIEEVTEVVYDLAMERINRLNG